jgi:hypothetical protein
MARRTIVIDREQALAIVRNEVSKRRFGDISFVVREDLIAEYPFGWMFVYVPDPALVSDPTEWLGGGPIIVDRPDGSVHRTGSAEEPDIYAERYARTGSPHEHNGP